MNNKITYDTINQYIDTLAQQIGNNKYDFIISLGRGGMIPTALLSHRLNIPIVHHISYSRKYGYQGNSITDIQAISDKKVLLVDDACESGGSFVFGVMLLPFVKQIDTACLLLSTESKFIPTFHAATVSSDDNITMPWEKD